MRYIVLLAAIGLAACGSGEPDQNNLANSSTHIVENQPEPQERAPTVDPVRLGLEAAERYSPVYVRITGDDIDFMDTAELRQMQRRDSAAFLRVSNFEIECASHAFSQLEQGAVDTPYEAAEAMTSCVREKLSGESSPVFRDVQVWMVDMGQRR